jgi:hypothetical protein
VIGGMGYLVGECEGMVCVLRERERLKNSKIHCFWTAGCLLHRLKIGLHGISICASVCWRVSERMTRAVLK